MCQSSSGDSKENNRTKQNTSPAVLRLVELEKECFYLLQPTVQREFGKPRGRACVWGDAPGKGSLSPF